jgi:hypothetical protein
MNSFPGMTPEYAVDIFDRLSQQLFKLLGMGFQRRKILFPGSALVRDNHNATVRESPDGRKVFPESLVIENKVGSGIDRGVKIEPEEDSFSAAP